jgi:hypothetical protein
MIKSKSGSRDIVLVLSIVAVVIALVLSDLIVAEWHAKDAEGEIALLAGVIQRDSTRGSVAQAFAHGSFDYLKLRTGETANHWVFQTPSRFGGGDWILIVEFQGERVIAVRVGTSDNARRRERAPADRNVPVSERMGPCGAEQIHELS